MSGIYDEASRAADANARRDNAEAQSQARIAAHARRDEIGQLHQRIARFIGDERSKGFSTVTKLDVSTSTWETRRGRWGRSESIQVRQERVLVGWQLEHSRSVDSYDDRVSESWLYLLVDGSVAGYGKGEYYAAGAGTSKPPETKEHEVLRFLSRRGF